MANKGEMLIADHAAKTVVVNVLWQSRGPLTHPLRSMGEPQER
jgi:hypothetical protein